MDNLSDISTTTLANTSLDYQSFPTNTTTNESTCATIGSDSTRSYRSSSSFDEPSRVNGRDGEDFGERTDADLDENSILADKEIEELDIKNFSPIGPNVGHPPFSADRMFIDTPNSDNGEVNQEVEELLSNEEKQDIDEPLDLNNLPDTVTVLPTFEGHVVYLVGTSHFSEASQRDVRRVIRAVRPKIVVLELCRSRLCFLTMSEEEIMREAQSLDFKKIREYVRKNGFLQGFIFTVLLVLSAKVSNDLNMAPGGEFRNAYSEACRIQGCSVLLGDRPIDITLRRAMSMLSFWQKMKMAWNCFSFDKVDKKELELYKQRDVLEELIRELTEEYPGLKKVMVDERDAYLANNLWNACNSLKPGEPVVGVVGIGHSQGIQKYWENAKDIEIEELLSMPTSKPSIVGCLAKYSVYSGLAYVAYRYAAPKVLKTSINEMGRQLLKIFY